MSEREEKRKALEDIRDRLTRALDEATDDPRALVQITRELRATWAELDALPLAKETSAVDEVAAKREERRSRTSAASGT